MTTLVVLERDTLLRRSLRILLEMEDYTVVEVATAEAAVTALRKLADPCVLVVNHRLPEMDALLVLIRVANDPDLVARHRVVIIPSLHSPLQQPLLVAVQQLDVRIMAVPYDLHTLYAVIGHAARHHADPGPGVAAHETDDAHQQTGMEGTTGAITANEAAPRAVPQPSFARRSPSLDGHRPPPEVMDGHDGTGGGHERGAQPE